jgi:hypothetical protein
MREPASASARSDADRTRHATGVGVLKSVQIYPWTGRATAALPPPPSPKRYGHRRTRVLGCVINEYRYVA